MKQLITLFILLFWGVLQIYAQVTIGSGFAPNRGTLLDLKEDQTAGVANSSKGIMLPRVRLSNLTPKIGKLSESIGNTGAWDEVDTLD